MKFVRPPQIREGYGDTRFKQVMDPESRLSRHLKLNLFPPRIWRRDAYLVLKTVGHALQALESLSEGHRSVADDRFEFRGRDMSLYDVIAELHADHGRE